MGEHQSRAPTLGAGVCGVGHFKGGSGPTKQDRLLPPSCIAAILFVCAMVGHREELGVAEVLVFSEIAAEKGVEKVAVPEDDNLARVLHRQALRERIHPRQRVRLGLQETHL